MTGVGQVAYAYGMQTITVYISATEYTCLVWVKLYKTICNCEVIRHHITGCFRLTRLEIIYTFLVSLHLPFKGGRQRLIPRGRSKRRVDDAQLVVKCNDPATKIYKFSCYNDRDPEKELCVSHNVGVEYRQIQRKHRRNLRRAWIMHGQFGGHLIECVPVEQKQ